MAQVRKLQQGGSAEKQPKLFSYEGIGDFDVSDLVSSYASNVQNTLKTLNLNDKDYQRVADESLKIIKGIEDGTIKGRNSLGNFLSSDPTYSSTGTFNKRLFGLKKDDNYYRNIAAHVVSESIGSAPKYVKPTPQQSTEQPTKTKEKAPKQESYNLNIDNLINNEYFGGKGFDPARWDYNNSNTNLLNLLQSERQKIEGGDYSNKEDLLNRIDATIGSLNSGDYTNAVQVGSRLGADFRNYLKNPAWDQPTSDPNLDGDPNKQNLTDQPPAPNVPEEVTWFNPQDKQTYTGRYSDSGNLFISGGNAYPIKGEPVFELDGNKDNWYEFFSPDNLNLLEELFNYRNYDGKREQIYKVIESSERGSGDHVFDDKVSEKFVTNYRKWLEGRTAKIRETDFPLWRELGKALGTNADPSKGTFNPKWYDVFLGRGLGFQPQFPIEKGSLQDKRLEFTERLGEKTNEWLKRFFTNPERRPETQVRREGGIISYQSGGGFIPLNQINPSTIQSNVEASYLAWLKANGKENNQQSLDEYINLVNQSNQTYNQLKSQYNNNAIPNDAVRNFQRNFHQIGAGKVQNIAAALQQAGFNANPRTAPATSSYGYDIGSANESNIDGIFGVRTNNYFFTPQDLEGNGLNLGVDANGNIIQNLSTDPLKPGSIGVAPIDKPTTVNPANIHPVGTGRVSKIIGGIPKTRSGLGSNLPSATALGLGRLAGTLATNNRIARTLTDGIKPLLIDAPELSRRVTGDLPARSYLNNLAADARRRGSRPITSNANLQLANQLEYNRQANDLEVRGLLADKEALERTSAEARAVNDQNIIARNQVANQNRASQLQTIQAKANIEAQRRNANWSQAIAPWLAEKESIIRQNDQITREADLAGNRFLLQRNYEQAADAATNNLEAARQKYLSSGNPSGSWLTSPDYKSAYSNYTSAINNAYNQYNIDNTNAVKRSRLTSLFLKNGGNLEDITKKLIKKK